MMSRPPSPDHLETGGGPAGRSPTKRLWRKLAPALLAFGLPSSLLSSQAEAARPNILWISMEDISPDFGCYGVKAVTTPNFDALAKQGVRFGRAFSTAGVCAPSRSAIISGVYQMAIGTQHMRSNMPKPAGGNTLPEVMRRAGYYCSNNSKQDYNFDGRGMWDASDATAHWRQRKEGKPFFSIFNILTTHESQTWGLKNGAAQLRQKGADGRVVRPEDVSVPSYYVDTPVVREHLANYYNLISGADLRAGEILAELKADGLADDTIVFVWGDHGRGLPRGKFWSYTISTQVPLVVYVPPKFQAALSVRPGQVDQELRSLLDLFPSVLAAAGVTPPAPLHGRSLFARDGHPTLLAGRDRLGVRQDLTRALRTKDLLYIRNFVHDDAYVSTSKRWFSERSPIQVEMWKHAATLNAEQAGFFSQRPRPAEELYAWETDREETHNLALNPAAQTTLAAMRGALAAKMKESGDSGFVPEHELFQMLNQMHEQGASPLDKTFRGWPEPPAWLHAPLEPTPKNIGLLMQETRSPRIEQRYWALRELLNGHASLTEVNFTQLAALLKDPSIDVRLQTIRLLVTRGRYDHITGVLEEALAHPYAWSRTVALGIIEEMPDDIARRFVRAVENTKEGGYVSLLRPYLLARLQPEGGKAARSSK